MKRTFYLLATAFLVISLFSNFSCGKKDDQQTDGGDEPGTLPDDNTSYIAYYVLADGIDLPNPKFMIATDIDPLRIGASGDTTNLDFSFSNRKIKNDVSGTNIWEMCDIVYDENGRDVFRAYSFWTGGTTGEIEEGKTYHFSYFKDGIGPLSIDMSRGMCNVYHYNPSMTMINRLDSYFGDNGANVSASYIKVDKIENGKASGSFGFGFRNPECARPNGFPYANNVVGKFNKIAIIK